MDAKSKNPAPDREPHVESNPAIDVDQFKIKDMRAYAREVAHGGTVLVFDTTLRDGEQSPGATLNSAEKLDIAHQLARLGVDIMEAGFPAASPGDLAAVRQIAQTVGRTPRIGRNGEVTAPPVIAGLHRGEERYRQGVGGRPGGGAPADTHLPRHERSSHAAQTAHVAQRSPRGRG